MYKSVKEAVESREGFFQQLEDYEQDELEQEIYERLSVWLEGQNVTNEYIATFLKAPSFYDLFYYEVSQFTSDNSGDIGSSSYLDFSFDHAETYALGDTKVSSYQTRLNQKK